MITLYDYHFDDNYPFAMTGSHVYITTFYDYHFAMRIHTRTYHLCIYVYCMHTRVYLMCTSVYIMRTHVYLLTYTRSTCVSMYWVFFICVTYRYTPRTGYSVKVSFYILPQPPCAALAARRMHRVWERAQRGEWHQAVFYARIQGECSPADSRASRAGSLSLSLCVCVFVCMHISIRCTGDMCGHRHTLRDMLLYAMCVDTPPLNMLC